uniref:ARAD1A02046p n=1 Tax=Blastobotrys adeninivorans TaxID=409370 RepID=A0A060SX63_BLAAD
MFANNPSNSGSLFGSPATNSIFGSSQQGQQGSQQSSMFANSGSSNQFGGSLGQNTQNQLGQNPGQQGLGQSQLGQSFGGQGQSGQGFGQNQLGQSQLGQSQLVHSQSAMDLHRVNSPYKPGTPTPTWGRHERKQIPSHLSGKMMRHKSSFNTERASTTPSLSSATTASSASSPPSASYSTSSFGTPKPTQSKKSSFIDEESLPPTESIYDTGASPFVQRNTPISTSRTGPSSSRLLSNSPRRDGALPPASNSFSSSKTQEPLASSQSLTAQASQNCSIIVYGFPPQLASVVVKSFSKYGAIQEQYESSKDSTMHKPAPPIETGKNWMKITYDNPTSAARAISSGNTAIGGYIVGVAPYSSTTLRQLEGASGDESNDQVQGLPTLGRTERSLPRTISMPVLSDDRTNGNGSGTPGRRIEVKDGRGIFSSRPHRQIRLAPSMNNFQAKSSDSRLGEKQSWLSWTARRAQELVFGWDDL